MRYVVGNICAFLVVAFLSSAVGQQLSGGGGGICGSDKQVQFNDGGACGAKSTFTFDKGANALLLQEMELRAPNISGQAMLLSPNANEAIVFGQSASSQKGMFITTNTPGSLIGWLSGNYNNSSDTAMARNAAGVVEINNGTAGTYRDLILRTMTATGLASDATHTDNTVCVDSSSGLFYKGSGTLGVCLGTSSARFKQDIKPSAHGMAEIAALKPVNYRYKSGYGDDGAKQQLGFIAEDVAKTSPSLVGLDADGKPNSVDMLAIVPMLVKAVQEQQTVIDCLRGGGKKC